MPASTRIPSFGGTSFWVKGPEEIDSEELARKAGARGVLIEPGRINFNPAFLGQVVLYGVLPAGALVATMFPEVGAVVFSWLQPLSRVLH